MPTPHHPQLLCSLPVFFPETNSNSSLEPMVPVPSQLNSPGLSMIPEATGTKALVFPSPPCRQPLSPHLAFRRSPLFFQPHS